MAPSSDRVAPLFPPWANLASRLSLTGLVLASIVVPSVVIARAIQPAAPLGAVAQPVAFDHRSHVRDDRIDCLYCHYDAERSPHGGVPPTAVCMGCHGHLDGDLAKLGPLLESDRTGQPIRWRRVATLPDHVTNDHAAHARAGVGCERCHGRVEDMPAIRPVVVFTMRACVACHRDPGPGHDARRLTTCTACHR